MFFTNQVLFRVCTLLCIEWLGLVWLFRLFTFLFSSCRNLVFAHFFSYQYIHYYSLLLKCWKNTTLKHSNKYFNLSFPTFSWNRKFLYKPFWKRCNIFFFYSFSLLKSHRKALTKLNWYLSIQTVIAVGHVAVNEIQLWYIK